jgi:hypothetical protein
MNKWGGGRSLDVPEFINPFSIGLLNYQITKDDRKQYAWPFAKLSYLKALTDHLEGGLRVHIGTPLVNWRLINFFSFLF